MQQAKSNAAWLFPARKLEISKLPKSNPGLMLRLLFSWSCYDRMSNWSTVCDFCSRRRSHDRITTRNLLESGEMTSSYRPGVSVFKGLIPKTRNTVPLYKVSRSRLRFWKPPPKGILSFFNFSLECRLRNISSSAWEFLLDLQCAQIAGPFFGKIRALHFFFSYCIMRLWWLMGKLFYLSSLLPH